MKNLFLTALLAAACTFCAKSQTKGTNSIGLGFTAINTDYESSQGGQGSEQKTNRYSLSYGRFIKDNVRLGVSGNYGYGANTTSGTSYKYANENYGGSASLYQFFPLIKKLYAFGGGGASYTYGQTKYTNYEGVTTSGPETNRYSLDGSAGLAVFLKHFAFEAQLIGANVGYTKTKYEGENNTSTEKLFNLSTAGSITNLGFNIYFLF